MTEVERLEQLVAAAEQALLDALHSYGAKVDQAKRGTKRATRAALDAEMAELQSHKRELSRQLYEAEMAADPFHFGHVEEALMEAFFKPTGERRPAQKGAIDVSYTVVSIEKPDEHWVGPLLAER